MNHRSSLAPVVCASLFALTQCSSSQTPVPHVDPHAATRPVAVAEGPVDLSEVPAPATLLFTVRSPSPRGLARHLGERLGLGELVAGLEEQLPAALGDDEALAHVVDLDAPADIIAYRGPRGRLRAVIAFGAVSIPRAEDALSQGHRLTAVSNGTRRIERTPAPEGNAGTECVLAPRAGGDTHAARLVCAERYEYIADALPFLTRTLPRHPMSADVGDLQVELAVDALRDHLADDAQTLANSLPEELTPSPDPNNAGFQDLVRSYARDQLARTVTLGLQDLTSATLTLRFASGAATLAGEARFRSLQAPILSRLVATVRDAHPSLELLNRLPPSASSFGTAGFASEPMTPERDLLGPVIARTLIPTATVPAADATALRNALAGLFHVTGHNRSQTAFSSGHRQDGAMWSVGVSQLDVPAATFVAPVRALIAALRRPAVARAVNTEWHLNPMLLQTLPAPGLPAGTLFVRMPVPATVSRDLRNRFSLGSSIELLVVPEGNLLWTASGVDVIARYREAHATHAAPVQIAGLDGDGVVGAGAWFPMGIAQMLSRIDPQLGRNVQRGLQGARGGNTPMTAFLRVRTEGDGAVVGGDLNLPDSVLGSVGGMFRQSP